MLRQTPESDLINSTISCSCRTRTRVEKGLFSSSASIVNFLPGAAGSTARLSRQESAAGEQSTQRPAKGILISEASSTYHSRDFGGD